MATNKISQVEARRLRRRVAELERRIEEQHNRYRTDYPGGVHLCVLTGLSDRTAGKLAAAQLIGCALVARFDDSHNRLHIYAVPRR